MLILLQQALCQHKKQTYTRMEPVLYKNDGMSYGRGGSLLTTSVNM